MLQLLDAWENMEIVMEEISGNPHYFPVLMELALYNTAPISWRAAYIADKIHEFNPAVIVPYLEKMIDRLASETHTGKKRHFLKLISLHTIHKKHFGFLVNKCLDWLTSAKEPPAVRVHAMQILYNISEKEPDLKPELLAVIRHEMEHHGTPGINSRGLKLVRKLEKQIHQKQPI